MAICQVTKSLPALCQNLIMKNVSDEISRRNSAATKIQKWYKNKKGFRWVERPLCRLCYHPNGEDFSLPFCKICDGIGWNKLYWEDDEEEWNTPNQTITIRWTPTIMDAHHKKWEYGDDIVCVRWIF